MPVWLDIHIEKNVGFIDFIGERIRRCNVFNETNVFLPMLSATTSEGQNKGRGPGVFPGPLCQSQLMSLSVK